MNDKNIADIPDDLRNVMREHYQKLIDFVQDTPFRGVLDELYSLSRIERPKFVREVILNDEALLEKGVSRPNDILLQISSFGDQRPTLFVVKTYLPENYRSAWENVNLTFDQDMEGKFDENDEAESWRQPLPMPVQAALTAMELTKRDIVDYE